MNVKGLFDIECPALGAKFQKKHCVLESCQIVAAQAEGTHVHHGQSNLDVAKDFFSLHIGC